MRLRALALFCALLVLPFPLLADTVYTYTGNPFTYIYGSTFTSSDFISGSFTLSSPLGANLAIGTVTPIAFSFSDDVDTITNTTPNTYADIAVGTDAAGDITSWYIYLWNRNSNADISSDVSASTQEDAADTGGPARLSTGAVWVPGTWSVTSTGPAPSPVPEPSTLSLLATGALGLIGTIRRRSGRLTRIGRKFNYGNIALIAVILLACGSPALFAQMPISPKLFASEAAIASFTSTASSSNMANIEAASTPASDAQSSPVLSPGARLVNSTPRPFSTVGAAVSVGTLGIGGQVAAPLSQRTNLRAEGNFFSYNGATYTNDGINYTGTLKLRSAEAMLDWFPFGGSFRLSPGVPFYSGLGASATLAVPSGQSFSLNHVSYASSTTVPVTGTASLTTNVAAPMFTFGWGNLVPRREHGHFSVPVELGFVYLGAPKVAIALAGKACDPSGLNCRNVTSDTGIQSNLAAQQKIVSDDIGQYFKFYPVFSLGFGYKF